MHYQPVWHASAHPTAFPVWLIPSLLLRQACAREESGNIEHHEPFTQQLCLPVSTFPVNVQNFGHWIHYLSKKFTWWGFLQETMWKWMFLVDQYRCLKCILKTSALSRFPQECISEMAWFFHCILLKEIARSGILVNLSPLHTLTHWPFVFCDVITPLVLQLTRTYSKAVNLEPRDI